MIFLFVVVFVFLVFFGFGFLLLVGVVLVVVVRDGGHHHHDGNGRHNCNIFTQRSPTHNRGYQHTNNGNAGGTNPVQNALCRNVTVCNISQKVNIVRPERPAPAVPLEAIPETQSAVRPERPEPAQTELPVRQAARSPRGPFMYLGAEGFLLVAPGSGAPVAFGASANAGAFLPGLFGRAGQAKVRQSATPGDVYPTMPGHGPGM